MLHDYDDYYDTKVSRPYGSSKIGIWFGIIFIVLGLIDIIITVIDLYITNFNVGQSQKNANLVYTWDENPFWPTYGKGFWVGLLLIFAGIIGLVSSMEHTITSIYCFAALSALGALFSFYMLISASIPVAKYDDFGGSNSIFELATSYYNSFALNIILITLGAIGLIGGTLASIFSCILVGCCSERRGYGVPYLHKYYRAQPMVPAATMPAYVAANMA